MKSATFTISSVTVRSLSPAIWSWYFGHRITVSLIRPTYEDNTINFAFERRDPVRSIVAAGVGCSGVSQSLSMSELSSFKICIANRFADTELGEGMSN
jgi:hypothetical protein